MKGKLIEMLKSISWGVLGILFFVCLILLAIFLLRGAIWISEKILPILLNLTGALSVLCFFVFLPMTILKKTRKWGGTALAFSSLLFGTTLWVYSALTVYILWGFIGLSFGLLIFGIGVVPISLLAALVNNEHMILGSIIYMLILTFITRIFGLWIVEKEENNELKNDNYE